MRKTSHHHVPLAAAALLLAVAPSGCMSVEADFPELEITQHDVVLTASPVPGTVQADVFSQKKSAVDLPYGLDSEIHALDITLIAKTGIEDFSFIDVLRLTMSDAEHGEVQLFNYVRPAGAVPQGVLTVTSANPVDIFQQWRTESARFNLAVVGTLPDHDWSVDVRARFSAMLRYDSRK